MVSGKLASHLIFFKGDQIWGIYGSVSARVYISSHILLCVVLLQAPAFFSLFSSIIPLICFFIGCFNNSMEKINRCEAMFSHCYMHSELSGSSISLTSDKFVEPADRIRHEDNQIVSSALSSHHTSSDLDPSAPKTPMKGIIAVINVHTSLDIKSYPNLFSLDGFCVWM